MQKKKKNPGSFKKGKDARRNIKGRPKRGHSIADILRTIGDEMIPQEWKDEIEASGINTKLLTKKEAILYGVFLQAMQGEAWAVNFITDRTEGKAVQVIETKNITSIEEMTDAELTKIAKG